MFNTGSASGQYSPEMTKSLMEHYSTWSKNDLRLLETTSLYDTISFGNGSQVAYIDSDGIFHFTVEANDENALKFIECIERVIGRRITGIKNEN